MRRTRYRERRRKALRRFRSGGESFSSGVHIDDEPSLSTIGKEEIRLWRAFIRLFIEEAWTEAGR